MPARKIDLPVAEMAGRYEAGENTFALGDAYGVGQRTVVRRLHDAGVKMRSWSPQPGERRRLGKYKHGGPLCTDSNGYLVTCARNGKRCYVHRGCYEAHVGAIPDGHVIHHINGDILDNPIGNLACMTNSDHLRLHHRKAHKCT